MTDFTKRFFEKRDLTAGDIIKMRMGQPLESSIDETMRANLERTGYSDPTGARVQHLEKHQEPIASKPKEKSGKGSYFHYKRGLERFEKKEYAGAIADFKTAIVKQPDCGWFDFQIAKVLYTQGHFKYALESAKIAAKKLQREPGRGWAYLWLAHIWLELGEKSKAIHEYRHALSVNKRNKKKDSELEKRARRALHNI